MGMSRKQTVKFGTRVQHLKSISVWCEISGFICPYFFESVIGQAIADNVEQYKSIITNCSALNWMMRFQQDVATWHTAPAKFGTLHERFESMIISFEGNIYWPQGSCDLIPLGFFWWDILKSHVNANKPQTISALKANISHALGQIQPYSCERVIQKWNCRMRAIQQSRSVYLLVVILHR